MCANRRKILVVDRKFQFKFLAFNTLFLLMFAFIIGAAIYLSVMYSMVQEFSTIRIQQDLRTASLRGGYITLTSLPFVRVQAQMLSEHHLDTLNSILKKTNMKLIPVVAIMITFILFVSLLFSHRIAGPGYRFKKGLRAVLDGDLSTSFSLRDKDEFKDVAALLDQVMSRFAYTLKSIITHTEAIKTTATHNEVLQHVKEIVEAVGKYKY